MTTRARKSVDVNNSNIAFQENEVSKVSKNVKTKANILTDTANVLEDETLKKKEVFAAVKELFGFTTYDPQDLAVSLAKDLADGKINYKEFTEKLANDKKETNKLNESLENVSFEDVCKKIEESDLLNDVSVYLGGCKDLVSLKSKLLSDNKVVLFHGKQSEDSEKFETFTVSVNGLHKPYKDVCYVSYLDYSVSNLIRAFRNYSYYLASFKRCIKMKEEETNTKNAFIELRQKLHEKFGYMPEDFENL